MKHSDSLSKNLAKLLAAYANSVSKILAFRKARPMYRIMLVVDGLELRI